MIDPLLQRKHHTPPPGLPFLGGLALRRARVHELCGDARRTLALLIAQAVASGPVFWIVPRWQRDRLYGPGLVRFIEPARLFIVEAQKAEDILWSMEEILRAGHVPLVVAELESPPALTPVRRLHLAAEDGAVGRRKDSALGLLLCPGEGGAQGIESRWHFSARDSGGAPGWQLARTRARAMPPASWTVRETAPADAAGRATFRAFSKN
ncbi:MAG: ImuA family protein [Halocynthiibacter sp.]